MPRASAKGRFSSDSGTAGRASRVATLATAGGMPGRRLACNGSTSATAEVLRSISSKVIVRSVGIGIHRQTSPPAEGAKKKTFSLFTPTTIHRLFLLLHRPGSHKLAG